MAPNNTDTHTTITQPAREVPRLPARPVRVTLTGDTFFMRIFTPRTTAVVAAGLIFPLALTACGKDNAEDSAPTETTVASSGTTTSSATTSETVTSSTAKPTTTAEATTTGAAETTEQTSAAEAPVSSEEAEAAASSQAQALQEELDRLKTEIPTVTEGKPADDEVKKQLTDLETKVNSLDPNLDILQFFCEKDRTGADTAEVVEYRRQMLTVLQQTGQQVPAPTVDITDLTVSESGKEASGTVHLSINLPGAQPQSTPQGFVKENGQWKVCTLKK